MKLPIKGKDIIAKGDNGDTYYIYRCNCHNKNCKEWRCSMTGFSLMINIVEWEYVEE